MYQHKAFAQGPATVPAVVSGNVYLFWEAKLVGEKMQLLNKILKRNRSEEPAEIETFNAGKIIMTEWKIIFIPSYFDFKHWKFFYGLELLPLWQIMVLDWQLFLRAISLNLRFTDGSNRISWRN